MKLTILALLSTVCVLSSASAYDVITMSERSSSFILQATDKADKLNMLGTMTDCFEPNTNVELDSVMLHISCKTRVIKFALDHGYNQNVCGGFVRQ
jgi:hypothetical protein